MENKPHFFHCLYDARIYRNERPKFQHALDLLLQKFVSDPDNPEKIDVDRVRIVAQMVCQLNTKFTFDVIKAADERITLIENLRGNKKRWKYVHHIFREEIMRFNSRNRYVLVLAVIKTFFKSMFMVVLVNMRASVRLGSVPGPKTAASKTGNALGRITMINCCVRSLHVWLRTLFMVVAQMPKFHNYTSFFIFRARE